MRGVDEVTDGTLVLLSMDYEAEGFVESRGAANGSWRGERGTGPGLGTVTAG